MVRDEEGFDYPAIAFTRCIDCGKCEQVCPWKRFPKVSDRLLSPAVSAAWNLDEDIRRKSSSGGVFSAIARHVLARGGFVVGAALTVDCAAVEHVVIDTDDKLHQLQCSKYVQSSIKTSVFDDVKHALNASVPVLFSGCPCQVAGLRFFLERDYPDLFTIDLVCRGVPSPGWYKHYLKTVFKNKVTGVTFRDKDQGWRKIGIKLSLESGKTVKTRNSEYMLAFFKYYSLRRSCYTCPYACLERVGDVTLGDFWGIGKYYPRLDIDDKGVSLIITNTTKGQGLIAAIKSQVVMTEVSIESAVAGNSNLVKATEMPAQRKSFLQDSNLLPFSVLRKKYSLLPSPIWMRVGSVLKSAGRKMFSSCTNRFKHGKRR